jgi:hypothetical protein
MKPWVVDAKDIEPEDLDQFSGQLLHLNNQIADFLDPATTEAVLVIAPKGFGKTLLLEAKRQSMRERYRTILPERALVDKPSANPDPMSHREDGSVRETEAHWKALWSIALTLAVEKQLGICPEPSGPLDKIVRNEHLRSACDLFTNLLALLGCGDRRDVARVDFPGGVSGVVGRLLTHTRPAASVRAARPAQPGGVGVGPSASRDRCAQHLRRSHRQRRATRRHRHSARSDEQSPIAQKKGPCGALPNGRLLALRPSAGRPAAASGCACRWR